MKLTAEEYIEPVKMLTTAYCQGHTTASGIAVRRGICAGSKKMIGKTAIIYTRSEDGGIGEYLGIWEIEDTGGSDGIRSGEVLDIYLPTLDECCEWMALTDGKIYAQIIDAQG